MMDNPRPKRPNVPLMPPIWGSATPANGVPHNPVRPVSSESDFLEALPVIDDVTARVCRRHRLAAVDAEEFQSDVRLHFIQRDYEVLRQFEGRCALSTYVTVVVQRLFFDWRNKRWGRWRPSLEAKRLGPDAILIEQLVVRDGWPMDQALEIARVNHRADIDDAVRAFCNTLSARAVRRPVSEDDAVEIPSPGPSTDVRVVMAERDFQAKRVLAALDRALRALSPTERLILKMLFEDGVAISDIAKTLHLEQRPLYRTRDDLKDKLRASLEAEGISRESIDELLNAREIEWQRDADGQAPPATTARQERKGASWLRTR